MATGRVINSGDGQIVQLPEDFHIDAGEIEITRDGDKIVMLPQTKTHGQRVIEALQELSDLIEVPPDLPVQHREGL